MIFRRILVVCTGNICRSPMAQGLLQKELNGTEAMVESAGTAAWPGREPDPLAVSVAAGAGVDISDCRSRQISEHLATAADLILAAEQEHVDWMLQRFPVLRGRVFRLGHWRDEDIADPYGRDEDAFRQALANIEGCVADWIPRLG